MPKELTTQEIAEIEDYYITAKRTPTPYDMCKKFSWTLMNRNQMENYIAKKDLLSKRTAHLKQEVESYQEQMRMEGIKNRILVGTASKDLFVRAYKTLIKDFENGTALVTPKDLALFAKLAVDAMDDNSNTVKINNSKNLIINLGKDIDSCSPEELDEIIYEVANAEIEQK